MADRRRRRQRRRGRFRRMPSKRVIRERLNPLEVYMTTNFLRGFDYRRATIVFLLDMIGRDLLDSSRNNALPPMLQLFVCLRFFATGTFHKLIGDSMHISECTVGRCCKSVTEALLRIRKLFIAFPKDDKARTTKQEFIKIAGMPFPSGITPVIHQ